ncbi:MAG: hypothetical protein PHU44_06255 [Syntrophales bacterium]|nr:hypothetical protein [Syntrophales bacterium]
MSKKNFCNFLGLILAITAAVTLTFSPANGGRASFQEQFLEIKRKQLGPELGVSQQTVDQLLQIEQRYQAKRRKLYRDSKADFQRLRQAIYRPSPSAPEVKAILSAIKGKLQESQNLHQQEIQEEGKLLTPVQLARNILYHKKLLREAQNIKGRSSGKTAPFRPPSGSREIQVSRSTGSGQGSGDTYQEKSAYPEKEAPIMGQQAQLEKSLGVNRQTVVQLLQIRERYNPLRRQLISAAKNEFQQLEEVMRQRNPAEQEVKNILTNIRKKEQEMQALKQRQDEEEMAILTPVQQGRYLMFLIALRQQKGRGPRSHHLPADGGFATRPAGNAPPVRYPAAR